MGQDSLPAEPIQVHGRAELSFDATERTKEAETALRQPVPALVGYCRIFSSCAARCLFILGWTGIMTQRLQDRLDLPPDSCPLLHTPETGSPRTAHSNCTLHTVPLAEQCPARP